MPVWHLALQAFRGVLAKALVTDSIADVAPRFMSRPSI